MSDGFLEGKAALVTSSSRNLGAATAWALAARGAVVAVNYFKSSELAEALVADMRREFGGRHVAIKADMQDSAAVRILVEQASEALGNIQVLVNNYGPFSMEPFVEMAESEFRRVWDANVTAAFVATQAAVPGMRAASWGRIINISAGSAYLRNHSIYTLAKSAMITFTEELAVELAPEITVNCIAPGQIAESANDMAEFDPSFVARAIEATPAGRLVRRREVADIAAELCSPSWDPVTGATIPVDGGWRFYRF